MAVDPAILGQIDPLSESQRRDVRVPRPCGRSADHCPAAGAEQLAEVAACHHERADETGYPLALRNDQVSPLTRLVAAADVYAAMCTPRPYREAIDPRAALTDVMLMAERGELDTKAAAALFSLGLYPSGTVVELADGATAVVLSARDPRSAYQNAARPAVAVLADADGRPFPNPRFVDLAHTDAGNIVRTLSPLDRLQRLGRSYPEWT